MPDDAGEVFEAHRSLLFGVAYRMLGSVTEAEDIVQEAWLRWSSADRSAVTEPRAFLITIASRTAVDHLRRARTQRESYIGPWLPEPLLVGPDAADDAITADSVSMAMLVVLETLSPLERAVFVLHEAFGFTYSEIGAALGRSDEATRQLARRAREHVQARRPRFRADHRMRRSATERFIDAALGGDLTAMLKVLAPEVTLVTDSGGKTRAPRRPIVGADKVARFFAARAHAVPKGTSSAYTAVNGEPAAVLSLNGTPYAVVSVDLEPGTGLIEIARVFGNPDKLTGIERGRTLRIGR